MAGRKKITERKIKNLELGALDQVIKDKVALELTGKYPVTIGPPPEDEITNMSHSNFKEVEDKFARKILMALYKRADEEINNIPVQRLIPAIEMVHDILKDIHGEPTQRVEVTKRAHTPEEMDQLFRSLPKTIEAEEITDV